MRPFFTLLAIVAGSYLILRKICMTMGERQSTPIERFAIGIITWVFLLSSALWCLLPVYLIYLVLVDGNYGALFPLMFIGIASGAAYQTNELLDSGTVLFYVRESAFFRPMKRPIVHLEDELDKKTIRDIHKETSDKPFPTAGKKKRPLSQDETRNYRKQMTTASTRTARSRHLAEEIQALSAGNAVDISDGWTVYVFSTQSHDLYTEMSELRIDPRARALHFRLNIKEASGHALQTSTYLYGLKQDLYLLLQVLNTDPWLKWYDKYYDRMIAICYGIEPDSFGHVQQFAFFKIDIMRLELTQREGKFFNAADLHTICALTFNNGNPLPGTLV
jgi:hypothetical protein